MSLNDDSTNLTSIANAQALAVQNIQFLTSGVTSVQSNAVSVNTQRIVLTATQDVWVALGENPTATKGAGSFYLPAGAQSYPILVQSGKTKVAILQDLSSGNVSVIESA